jgi:hypothetical protein
MRKLQNLIHFRVTTFASLSVGVLAFTGCAGMQATRLQFETKQALAVPSPLKPVVQSCMEPGILFGQDGFGVAHVTPPVRRHFRPLDVGAEQDSVSVMTGHRIMYGYQDVGYFFANVKIERSDSAHYERDKEVIVRYHKSLQNEAAYSAWTLNEFTLHANESDSLNRGGVIGMYTGFLDREHLVVTAYLLNQGKMKRRFHTMEEYRALRDRFLNDLTTCVAAAGP